MYIVALGLSVLCFLGVVAYFWRSPAFSVFHPLTFYSAFHGIIFVLRPIFAYVYGYNGLYYAFEFTPSDSDKITVILASNLGFLVFSFFCLRAGSNPMQFKNNAANEEERRRLSQTFVWSLAICGPMALYSVAKTYSSTNNVYEGLIVDRATGYAINTTSNGYFADMQLMAVTLSALLIWLSRFRPIAFIPVIVFVIARAGTGGRGPFVAALVSAGLFYLYEKRMRYPAWRIIIAGAVAVALFTTVGADRGKTVRQAIGLEAPDTFTATDDDEQGPLESMDFGNMEFFEYLVYAIPQRSGTYGYFLDSLQVFTEPVPRVFWKGKPVGEPFRRIGLYEYGRPYGMTRSLPGEGWYSLGWLGVVIWCGLWGQVLGAIYSSFARGPQTTFQTACYIVFLPTLVVAFRDGTLVSLAKQTGIYFTPIAVWWLAAKYTGVPKARDLAAYMLKRQHQPGEAANPDEPAGRRVAKQPARAATWLPPAVRRRRAALDATQSSDPAE